MTVLLDENLFHKMAHHLACHACSTAVECGWSGKKNGNLLGLAGPLFDVAVDARQESALSAESGNQTNRRADRSGAFEADSGPLPGHSECLAALARIQPRLVVYGVR